MYLTNKYTRWYNQIINTAKNRTLPNIYVEKHHVIPRSLGGNNSIENIVKLTAREHFICHRLLTKITIGMNRRKMVYALWSMSNRRSNNHIHYIPSSKMYAHARQLYIHQLSIARKGIPMSTEQKQKLRKPKPPGFREQMREIKKNISQETKDKMSAARKGKPSPFKGRTHTEESIQKIRHSLCRQRL